jgi:hypothetical protein
MGVGPKGQAAPAFAVAAIMLGWLKGKLLCLASKRNEAFWRASKNDEWPPHIMSQRRE